MKQEEPTEFKCFSFFQNLQNSLWVSFHTINGREYGVGEHHTSPQPLHGKGISSCSTGDSGWTAGGSIVSNLRDMKISLLLFLLSYSSSDGDRDWGRNGMKGATNRHWKPPPVCNADNTMIRNNVSSTKVRGSQSINQPSRSRWIKKLLQKKRMVIGVGQGRPRVDFEETMKVMEIETKTGPGFLINTGHHTRG